MSDRNPIWLLSLALLAAATLACSALAPAGAPTPFLSDTPVPIPTAIVSASTPQASVAQPTPTSRATLPPPTRWPYDAASLVQMVSERGALVKSLHMSTQMVITIHVHENTHTTPVASRIVVHSESDVYFGNGAGDGRAHTTQRTTLLGAALDSEAIIAGHRQWLRIGGQPWQENFTFKNSVSAPSDFISNPIASMTYLDMIKEAHWLADEPVDGAPTKHLSFTLDGDKMAYAPLIVEQIYGNTLAPEALAALLQDATLEGEVWIGLDTQFVRKQHIHLVLNLTDLPDIPEGATADMEITSSVTDINKPVLIQPPNSAEAMRPPAERGEETGLLTTAEISFSASPHGQALDLREPNKYATMNASLRRLLQARRAAPGMEEPTA